MCIFKLVWCKISVQKLTISIFWIKFTQQGISGKKLKKLKHHHWIPHIQISLLVPNFCFNWQFWFFWPDLSKKGFSGLKQKKWTPHIFYIILHVQIILVRNFSSNWRFWSFGPNWPKEIFPVKNIKSEHLYGILHIWINLGTKFQLKLIILNFWTKFTQNGISSWKQNKQSKDYKRFLLV